MSSLSFSETVAGFQHKRKLILQQLYCCKVRDLYNSLQIMQKYSKGHFGANDTSKGCFIFQLIQINKRCLIYLVFRVYLFEEVVDKNHPHSSDSSLNTIVILKTFTILIFSSYSSTHYQTSLHEVQNKNIYEQDPDLQELKYENFGNIPKCICIFSCTTNRRGLLHLFF